MRVFAHSSHRALTIDSGNRLASGGEATIYTVPEATGLLAKVYHAPTGERAAKLRVMLQHPPADPLAHLGQRAFAWPEDLLTDASGGMVIGYLMHRVLGAVSLLQVTNPRLRRQNSPQCTYYHRLWIARNLAAAVDEVHRRGYVIGDINRGNVLVSPESGLATLLDTDSMQIRDPATDTTFRCPVGTPEFTPPELRTVRFADQDREPAHDAFGLAVLIFLLVFDGHHPFSGRNPAGQSGLTELPERIAAGMYCFTKHRRWTPVAIPPEEIAARQLRELFDLAFVVGHAHPAQRPRPAEWCAALEAAAQALKPCGVDRRHVFPDHLAACPWCQRERLAQRKGRLPVVAQVPTPGMPVAASPLRSPIPRAAPAPTRGVPQRRPRRRLLVGTAAMVLIGAGAVFGWGYGCRHEAHALRPAAGPVSSLPKTVVIGATGKDSSPHSSGSVPQGWTVRTSAAGTTGTVNELAPGSLQLRYVLDVQEEAPRVIFAYACQSATPRTPTHIVFTVRATPPTRVCVAAYDGTLAYQSPQTFTIAEQEKDIEVQVASLANTFGPWPGSAVRELQFVFDRQNMLSAASSEFELRNLRIE